MSVVEKSESPCVFASDYAPSSRAREMGWHDDCVSIGDVFKDATPRARSHLGIGTKTSAPVRLHALQRMMHQIAGENSALTLASYVDANMTR